MELVYQGYKCRTTWNRFSSGALALQLVASGDCADSDVRDGEPLMGPTCTLPGVTLEEGEILVKDYSEHEGAVETLAAAGILANECKVVKAGLAEVWQCRLTDAAMAEARAQLVAKGLSA